MTYPLDLDELEEIFLVEELKKRKSLRDRGLCDYCGRKPETRPCKFYHRHMKMPKQTTECIVVDENWKTIGVIEVLNPEWKDKIVNFSNMSGLTFRVKEWHV